MTTSDVEQRSRDGPKSPKFERLTLNLGPLDTARLDQLSIQHQGNRTDAIRSALKVYAFVDEAITEGCKILIERPDGSIERVVFR